MTGRGNIGQDDEAPFSRTGDETATTQSLSGDARTAPVTFVGTWIRPWPAKSH
jgi:hypothetical protein